MTTRRTLDVSRLQTFAFGHGGLIWWGTAGYMVIEGSVFVIGLVVYFYLRLKVPQWPPAHRPPDLAFGTANLLLVLASILPNQWSKVAAERFDVRASLRWLGVVIVIGLGALVLRAFEFTTLNCRWDDSAYGSIVWVLLAMHTIHVAADVVESGVLAAVLVLEPVDAQRLVDVSENALYWHFIVAWWIPIYLAIYFGPRWL